MSGRAIISHDTLANGGWKLEDVNVRQPGEGELLVDMVATVSDGTGLRGVMGLTKY